MNGLAGDLFSLALEGRRRPNAANTFRQKIMRPPTAIRIATAVFVLGLLSPCFADDVLRKLDTDKSGTIDIEEAETAAAKEFIALDRDKNGTLDANELAGRLDAASLKDRDPDNDGSLDHNEYAKAVAIRFKAADADSDGTLDTRELNSPAGARLLKLIQ